MKVFFIKESCFACNIKRVSGLFDLMTCLH